MRIKSTSEPSATGAGVLSSAALVATSLNRLDYVSLSFGSGVGVPFSRLERFLSEDLRDEFQIFMLIIYVHPRAVSDAVPSQISAIRLNPCFLHQIPEQIIKIPRSVSIPFTV